MQTPEGFNQQWIRVGSDNALMAIGVQAIALSIIVPFYNDMWHQ